MIKMNIQFLGHTGIDRLHLTLSWRRPLSYRNQPIDLQSIVPNLSTRKQGLAPDLSSRNKTLVILIRNYVQADSKVACSSPILLDRLLCFNNLIYLIIFQQSLFPKKFHHRCLIKSWLAGKKSINMLLTNNQSKYSWPGSGSMDICKWTYLMHMQSQNICYWFFSVVVIE